MRVLIIAALVCVSPAWADKPAPESSTELLSAEDRAALTAPRCKPFVAARDEAMKKTRSDDPPDSFTAFPDRVIRVLKSLKRPSTVGEEDWTYCAQLYDRDAHAFRNMSIRREAMAVLAALGNGLEMAAEANHRWCSSTAHPVPANLRALEKGPYAVKASDWSDRAWKCAFGPPALTKMWFQYEMKVDAKAKTYEVTARGFPGGDGKLVTLVRRGPPANPDAMPPIIEVEDAKK